jgi:hypothetical protein
MLGCCVTHCNSTTNAVIICYLSVVVANSEVFCSVTVRVGGLHAFGRISRRL